MVEMITESLATKYRPVLAKDVIGQEAFKNMLKSIKSSGKVPKAVLFTGETGCGKTTLMNILGLVESYDSGSFVFNGKQIKRDGDYARIRRENIGFVFQNYNLIPSLTCRENIMLPTLYDRKVTTNGIESLADALNISSLLDRKVASLSGGEKQRVAFARALCLDPCILLADEPTGNLDSDNRNNVIEMLEKEHDRGRAVILITHDKQLSKRSTTAYELKEGVLCEK